MSPARFRECLYHVRWSQRSLASALDIDERQVRRWASGVYAMPAHVAAWLETLAAAHEQNPPPARNRD
jgi:hypothetical protein